MTHEWASKKFRLRHLSSIANLALLKVSWVRERERDVCRTSRGDGNRRRIDREGEKASESHGGSNFFSRGVERGWAPKGLEAFGGRFGLIEGRGRDQWLGFGHYGGVNDFRSGRCSGRFIELLHARGKSRGKRTK